jgi:pyruvate/2-oxoglutarate dehydrogenase complex dihydrolipoamide acyltransferase (E2) component
MRDGLFTVPIVVSGGQVTGWERGAYLVHDAAHHKEIGTDLRFLRYADGSVYEISAEAKDAILAADQAAQDAAQQAAQAQAEADAAAAAQAAIDAESASAARVAHLQALRTAYVAGTHALCDIFGIDRVAALPMLEIQQRGAQLTDMTLILQAMQTAMALSNIEGKLHWLDGDGALDRVSEVAQ